MCPRSLSSVHSRSPGSASGPPQNKWEHISERALDLLVDHLNTLNDTTPKIRCQGRAGVDPAFVLGLDTTLFLLEARGEFPADDTHHDEVETVTLLKGYTPTHAGHTHHGGTNAHTHTHDAPVDATDSTPISEQQLVDALSSLSKETVWRVKGFVRLERGLHILNWAFGRHELTPFDDAADEHRGSVKLTVMGERGEVKRAARKLAERIGAQLA